MNYYERHLGDYAKDTLHLSMLEHGAYTLLMDRYYSTERGIPSEQVYRVALARSKDEKAAVDSVLSEFFTLTDGLWIKGRIEEEIERYLSGEPEREAKKANEKNRLSKHRDERAALFKQLTDAGQHAVWNIGIIELRERVKNITETGKAPSPETQPATATETPATATQEPDTRHQTPVKTISASALLASLGVDVQLALDFIQLRKAKRAPITQNAMDEIQREADKAGLPLNAALRMCCSRGWQGFNAEWVKPKNKQDHLQTVADQLTGRSHVAVALG